MSHPLDETHDPAARSFVASANAAGCDFPIQNLPFGAFTNGQNRAPSLCVAIGDQLFSLATAVDRGLLDEFDSEIRELCADSCLNPLMALGDTHGRALRRAIFRLLREDSPRRKEVAACLCPQSAIKLVSAVRIENYTDFYASVHHATNVGALFRPENPLLPNYKWVPIGYHGRASSIVLSGTPVRRPRGQIKLAEQPEYLPSRQLDYEVEVGALIGIGNELGEPIAINDACEHIFGLCLVNDWSARDVQSWEYQPLGPFLGKNFATTISPWVVTAEALAPFRTAAEARPSGDPQPLAYLDAEEDRSYGGFDVTVEVLLQSEAMRACGEPPMRLSCGSLSQMYWTFAQMVAHHTSNGCDLRPGDLLASGTISGPGAGSRGCLLEITRRGAEPIRLPDGTERAFLHDGDEVILRAYCQRPGAARIGFGECRGIVLPA